MIFTVEPLIDLPDVKLIVSDVFQDKRGLFIEGYRESAFADPHIGLPVFVQGNVSVSHAYVARGLHYQVQRPQGKLMRTVAGKTVNLIVDMRRGSPTFGRSTWIGLSSLSHALWVPPGFANGFVALAPQTVVAYECSSYHLPNSDRALNMLDPALHFTDVWSAVDDHSLVLSDKDRSAPLLSEAEPVPEAEWRV